MAKINPHDIATKNEREQLQRLAQRIIDIKKK
jgi:hypothetical protein